LVSRSTKSQGSRGSQTQRKGIGDIYRQVVEASPSGMLVVDKSGTIRLINPQIERQFGYRSEELLGQSVEILVPTKLRSSHAELRERYCTAPETRLMGRGRDLFGRRKDGTEFPVEIGLNPIRTADSLFVIASVVDITERKRMEEQLRHTERLAELATLASGMAHEIGTPMNVILGRAEYLMRRIDDETTKKGLETIVTQVERITKIMNQLLTFARRRPSERRPVDLAKTIEDCLEIVQERLEREFDLSLIVTAPSVEYRVLTTAGEVLEIENPSKLPTPDKIELMEEPYVSASVFVPTEYMTVIYKLAQDKRGEHKSLEYLGKRVHIRFDFPLSEIVVDFYDKLKSVSKGYASFDYEFADFRPSDLVKLDILLNGDPVDALSSIIHRDKAYERGKALVEKLRTVIPRQLFEVAIQAAVGSRVIARETVKAMGKNVTAKCYGGDITRKRKLLERQKEGKKRMKQVGRVEVPQEAFLSVLKS